MEKKITKILYKYFYAILGTFVATVVLTLITGLTFGLCWATYTSEILMILAYIVFTIALTSAEA